MTLTDLIITPFADYAFMRRALAACAVLALSGTPLGVFMTLRRMTLVGDAMQHAILPGVAIAFALSGLSLWAMTIGGLIAGVGVALCAVGLTHYTQLKEDASFTLVYLVSLAAGVAIISMHGNSVDLLHMLFGDILAIDRNSLLLIGGVAWMTLLALAVFYRGLVIACFDPDFAAAAGRGGAIAGAVFFVLLVINLVAAFQALGTLMALGLMILPALSARFWVRTVDAAVALSVAFALAASPLGLLLSYHAHLPSGPAVVLTAGVLCIGSALCGRHGSVLAILGAARRA